MIAPASIKQTMIAIDAHRARHALPPLKSHRTTQMLRAMRQRRPTGAAFIGADPINIRTVLQALPTRPTTLTAPNARRVPLPRITFEQARLRALMLLRIVTMLRPGEPASIKRSTITTARHPADPNRIILRFNKRRAAATPVPSARRRGPAPVRPTPAPQQHQRRALHRPPRLPAQRRTMLIDRARFPARHWRLDAALLACTAGSHQHVAERAQRAGAGHCHARRLAWPHWRRDSIAPLHTISNCRARLCVVDHQLGHERFTLMTQQHKVSNNSKINQ